MADTTKIIHSLLFFANKANSKTISAMKAYKLIWLADRLHLRKFGRTITGDKYYAMPKGMVPTDAKHIVEKESTVLNSVIDSSDYIETLNNSTYKAKVDFNPYFFSKTDLDALETVYNVFGHLSARQLSALSHKYPEWLAYKEDIENENLQSSYPIDMNLCFENRDKEIYDIFYQNNEDLKIAKDLFNGLF